jgi:hypothetical protein
MSKTAGIIILKHLVKSNCSNYKELKKILEEHGYNPNSVYEYIKYYKNKQYLHVLKMSKNRVICINRELYTYLQTLLRTYK